MMGAHQIFSMFMIAVMTGFSFNIKANQVKVRNKGLFFLTLWVSFLSLWIGYEYLIKTKTYPLSIYFSFINFMFLLSFYKLCIEYLDTSKLNKIFKFVKYSLIGTLILCVIQKFELANQFFYLFDNFHSHNNPIVGFLGNPTQLSAFLAMLCPILFIDNNRESFLTFVLLILILIFTGTTKGNPSISGFVVLFFLSAYFGFSVNKNFFIFTGVISLIGILMCFIDNRFLDFSGRQLYLKEWIPLFKDNFIAGRGFGFVSEHSSVMKTPAFKHLHNEYLQYLLEGGAVGFVLIINLIKEFLSIKPNGKEQIVLKSIVIGFLVSCFFNYPSHLWMVSIYAMFAYGAFFAIQNERIKDQKYI